MYGVIFVTCLEDGSICSRSPVLNKSDRGCGVAVTQRTPVADGRRVDIDQPARPGRSRRSSLARGRSRRRANGAEKKTFLPLGRTK